MKSVIRIVTRIERVVVVVPAGVRRMFSMPADARRVGGAFTASSLRRGAGIAGFDMFCKYMA